VDHRLVACILSCLAVGTAACAPAVSSSAPTVATSLGVAPTPAPDTTAATSLMSLPPRSVRIGYPIAALSQLEFMYAVDEGVYARQGVDVDAVVIPPTPALAAMLNGEVQYVYAAASLLNSSARGLPVRTFFQGATGPTNELFARPEIGAAADLRGKTISVLSIAGPSRETTELLLEKHGVDPNQVQFIASGSAPAQMEQLRQGGAQAVTMSPPWTLSARREGFRSLAHIGQEVPYPWDLFATTAERLASDPSEVKALIRGTLEAQRLMHDDREAVIAWIVRRFDVEQDVATESLDQALLVHNASGELTRESVATYLRLQADKDPVLRDARYEDLVDMRPLQEVRQEMGASGAPAPTRR
jgi:ABC-type nitrate/sulfonate/bicarbonate transport system substrate-binding protein